MNRISIWMKQHWSTLAIAVGATLAVGGAGWLGVQNNLAQQTAAIVVPPTVTVDRGEVVLSVAAPGTSISTHEVQIVMPAVGSLTELPVQIGDRVAKDQLLAKLDDLSKAQAQIALKEAREAYQKAANYLEYLQTSQKVPQTETRLFLQQTRDGWRYTTRMKSFKGPAPEDWIIDAENDRALKKAAYENAQATLEQMDLKAPLDGIVLEVSAQVGQTISPGTVLFTLMDPNAIQVRATVVEEDLPLLQVGQPVNLFFDALPEKGVTGTLDRIVPRRDSDTQAIYPVYILLDQVPDYLADGMTVDASIVIEKQSDVLRLPRAVVHAHSDGTAEVDVWSNGQMEHRTVRVGLRGDSFVEITSGLDEGEAVVAQ
jgi:RND family efflux transporter, MFP subunit